MIHQSVSKLLFGHFNVNAYILCSPRMENSATFKAVLIHLRTPFCLKSLPPWSLYLQFPRFLSYDIWRFVFRCLYVCAPATCVGCPRVQKMALDPLSWRHRLIWAKFDVEVGNLGKNSVGPWALCPLSSLTYNLRPVTPKFWFHKNT